MKKISYFLLICAVLLYFILSPQNASEASLKGLTLWFHQLLPVLFPCSMLSTIIITSNLLDFNSPKSNSLISILIITICGFSFGCPIGCKLCCDFYSKNKLSKTQAQILCASCNNLSPAFVSTFVLDTILNLQYATLPTLCILYFPGIIFSCYVTFFTPQLNSISNKKTASRFQLNSQIIDAGIISSFTTLIKLCGYIVLFSIITSMLSTIPLQNPTLLAVISGIIESTNGIVLLKSIKTGLTLKYIIAIALTAFGGISGLFQSLSLLSDTDLSIYKYLLIKLFITAISIISSIIYCHYVNLY